MEKKFFYKGLILILIFLFLINIVFPPIKGGAEKTNLSKSELGLSANSTCWVIGYMQINNRTTDYIEVVNIFGFWITKGSYGGFFEKNELLYIYGFKGFANRDIVIGMCDNIVRP